MKAAIVREFKSPLEIVETESPKPSRGEVLIKVEACGVCHSDLHLAQGDWPSLAKIIKPLLVLGHEVVGRVIAKGEAVEDISIGDRVGVAWLHWACGECEVCLEGNENLCPKQMITGVTVDGGYAEMLKAKASHVVKVPDTLSSEEAAPLFCAGVTVYRAIKLANVKKGQRVAVFGVGGLGHLAVQILRNLEVEFIVVDVSEEKLDLARALGAAHTINAANEKASSAIRKLGGAHVAVVTASAKAAYDDALYSLRPSGTIVIVGLPAEPLSFLANALSAREARIIASSVGTRQDMREVLDLAAQGKVRCHVETRSLENVNEVFEEMKRGQITGRVVLTFNK
jgi:propanol-preferring alcohol dehydrogenase